VELYVDGVFVAQDTTGPILSVRRSTQTTIGVVASGFVGDIDEVRIFSRGLTATEIRDLAPPPQPRSDGLVLSYDLETRTPGGLMQDLSGQGHGGTLTGTTDVSGKVGRARHFAQGDRITTSPIQVPGANFTVAAWFNWTTNPSPYYSGIQGGGNSWELRVMAAGQLAVVFYQATAVDILTEVASPLAYNDGTWHYATGVLRSGLVELYVDGVLVAQDMTDPIASVRSSSLTVIGHVASDFVGGVDEVRVYSRALSKEEIASTGLTRLSPFRIRVNYDAETATPAGVSLASTLSRSSLAGWPIRDGNWRSGSAISAKDGVRSISERYLRLATEIRHPLVPSLLEAPSVPCGDVGHGRHDLGALDHHGTQQLSTSIVVQSLPGQWRSMVGESSLLSSSDDETS